MGLTKQESEAVKSIGRGGGDQARAERFLTRRHGLTSDMRDDMERGLMRRRGMTLTDAIAEARRTDLLNRRR